MLNTYYGRIENANDKNDRHGKINVTSGHYQAIHMDSQQNEFNN